MRAFLALPFLLVGCAGAPRATPTEAPMPEAPRPMTPHVAVPFVDGPAITDPGLRAWLDAHRADLLQLPVVVDFGRDSRAGGTRAWLGTDVAGPGAGAIEVRLDDSALGIALLDRLRQSCPVGPRICAVWLEGRWSGPEDPAFRVLHFVGPADANATHARIEAAAR